MKLSRECDMKAEDSNQREHLQVKTCSKEKVKDKTETKVTWSPENPPGTELSVCSLPRGLQGGRIPNS